ncbi:hypothetical protein AX16_004775 [Volvariella volvacea WC 439]|nr:hypothetical protein AX16_004775 [Volvariella volvacea WC 439]
MKQLFPLLGATVERGPNDTVSFVVQETAAKHCNQDEVRYISVDNEEEIDQLVDRLCNGPRMLSDQLLARLFILPHRYDNHLHILFHAAHLITDGMSNFVITRTLLDALSTNRTQEVDFRNRLALSLASEELTSLATLSPAKRRWRSLTARILHTLANSHLKGGHTLPRKFSEATIITPAKSGRISCSFSHQESARIIENCRRQKFTFGNAHPILGQVALARVLCRRWLRGEISPEEWEFRKREPMYASGPLNLRPLLDRTWFKMGGATNVMISIGFFDLKLSFMPLGAAANIQPGSPLPGFQDMLPHSRFMLRVNSIKRQTIRKTQDPLYMDRLLARLPTRVEYLRGVVHRSNIGETPDVRPIPVSRQSNGGFILTHGGSSLGNINPLLPHSYPSHEQHSANPVIQLLHAPTYLHCRPSELYLGAMTFQGQLELFIFWDRNVFDEAIVKEWLEEVRQAVGFYLGDGCLPSLDSKL